MFSFKRALIALCIFGLLLIIMIYTQSERAGSSGTLSDYHTFPKDAIFVSASAKSSSRLVAKDDLEKFTTIKNVDEIIPYLHIRAQLNGVNTNVYGFEDLSSASLATIGLFETRVVIPKKQKMKACLISDYFAQTAGIRVGDELQGTWIKCKVAKITESNMIFSKNFVVTDLVSAQNELIESDPFYKFLNKRSTEAVSCGRCHTVLTKAIKEAVREAALVFDPRMPVSGGFILVKDKKHIKQVISAGRPRVPDLSVRATRTLNEQRVLGPLYNMLH